MQLSDYILDTFLAATYEDIKVNSQFTFFFTREHKVKTFPNIKF